jgi:hypothetical protein
MATLFDMMADYNKLAAIDPTVDGCELLEVTPEAEVWYLRKPAFFPLSPRDFVIARCSAFGEQQSTIYSFSVTHPKKPPVEGTVRGVSHRKYLGLICQ